jgi:Abnormal spindle-like microcephaly-assoc'd, ASPM-SPD-2-Hydin/Cep192 domain 4/HYDIN/CFA65/VesB-like, Ig-like domain
VACVAALVLVVGGGSASAAPSYQLLAVDAQGAPLPGNSGNPTISDDGHAVAFAQQTGGDCSTSTVYLRDRQGRATTTVGTGVLPAVTGGGSKVAFVSCDSAAQAPSLILWSAGGSAPLATKAQWTEGASDTVKSVAVSPSGTVAAFTVGPAGGAATALWLAHPNAAPVKVNAPAGALGPVDVIDGTVVFVVGGRAFTTSAIQPGPPAELTVLGGSIAGLSVSNDGQTIAFFNGAGVYVSVKGATPVQVTTGALDPSVAPDGSAVAVRMNDSSVKVFTTAQPPAVLSAAAPIAAGAFATPVVAGGGRELAFLAQPGAAAGGTSSNVQVYGLGPSLSAPAVNFGDVGVGTTVTKPVTFTNDGTTAITPTAVSSSNSEFAVLASGTTCVAGRPVPVGQSCVVQIALTPAAAGARTATLSVAQQDGTWDAPSSTATLTANGVNGELSASPSTLDFGSVTIGTTSSARSFTVTNDGSLPTTIGTVLVSGGEASEFPLAGGTCAGATLAAGGTCTVSVSFKPGGTGERAASMDVAGSGGAAVSVALAGTGANPPRPALAASPTALDFGELIVGSTGTAQAVTVRNSGNVPNTPTVSVSGSAGADFTIASNGCGRSIAAGSSCTVNVSFSPTVPGARVATLAVSGTGGSSASVHLTGTGKLNPVLTVSPGVIVPSQVVTIAGTNFPAGATISLAWDVGGPAATAVADASGSFSVAAVVPAGVGGGTRQVRVASPPEAATAVASVLVQPPAPAGGPSSPVFVNSPAFRH